MPSSVLTRPSTPSYSSDEVVERYQQRLKLIKGKLDPKGEIVFWAYNPSKYAVRVEFPEYVEAIVNGKTEPVYIRLLYPPREGGSIECLPSDEQFIPHK
jgi:hypothetical protein